MTKQLRIGFLGLGLIGGSLAKTIRRCLPDAELYAYDVLRETIQEALQYGVINDGIWEWKEKPWSCDFVFLCAPVEENEMLVHMGASCLSEHGILTDVGSTKNGIHQLVRSLGYSHCFIGGHPMAGSERVGYRNSKDTLLENAYYLLTPEAEVPQESVHRYVHLVEAIGAIPLKITPSIHDYATAAISHLPHVVASALVTLVQRANTLYEVEQSTQPKESKETDITKATKETDITKATKETTSSICRTPTPDEMIDMEELLPSIAAGGFKDLTRIASSDPGIWQQICHANATNLRVLIEEYIRILQSYLDASVDESQTALEDLFAKAKQYRDDLPITNKNPHLGSPTIRVDIADEPGALAAIATLLALRQISIKNIGIMHNREWEEGVLRIEFYTEEKQMEAAKVLRQKGYSVYDA